MGLRAEVSHVCIEHCCQPKALIERAQSEQARTSRHSREIGVDPATIICPSAIFMALFQKSENTQNLQKQTPNTIKKLPAGQIRTKAFTPEANLARPTQSLHTLDRRGKALASKNSIWM